MGAFAVVNLPLVAGGYTGAPAVAVDVISAYPGTRSVELSASRDAVSFELHFPGNLSGLIRRLRDRRIAVGALAQISIPVVSLVPELVASESDTAARLIEGPEVWDAQFTRGHFVQDARLAGGRVEASIAVGSDAMHQVYDAMMSLGLVARDEAQTVTGAL